MYNEIMNILSAEAFKRVTTGEVLKIAEINAIIALLLKANIPYDMLFSPGDRRFARQVLLNLHITPSVTISFNLQFEAGPTAL